MALSTTISYQDAPKVCPNGRSYTKPKVVDVDSSASRVVVPAVITSVLEVGIGSPFSKS